MDRIRHGLSVCSIITAVVIGVLVAYGPRIAAKAHMEINKVEASD